MPYLRRGKHPLRAGSHLGKGITHHFPLIIACDTIGAKNWLSSDSPLLQRQVEVHGVETSHVVDHITPQTFVRGLLSHAIKHAGLQNTMDAQNCKQCLAEGLARAFIEFRLRTSETTLGPRRTPLSLRCWLPFEIGVRWSWSTWNAHTNCSKGACCANWSRTDMAQDRVRHQSKTPGERRK